MTTVIQNLSIQPDNQASGFSPGQKCIFTLPPDLGFLKASRGETLLTMSVRNNSILPMRWMLAAGGQTLIQNISVFSVKTGAIWEYLDNYNQMLYLLNEYNEITHGVMQTVEGMCVESYSLDWENGASVRRLIKPSSGEMPTEQDLMSILRNSEYASNNVFSPINKLGAPVLTSGEFPAWKIAIPLRLGIFNSFSEEKLCPLIALGGIRIEIVFADFQPSICPLACSQGEPDPSWTKLVQDDFTYNSGGITVAQGVDTSHLIVYNSDICSSGMVVGQPLTYKTVGSTEGTAVYITGMSELSPDLILTTSAVVDCEGVSGRVAVTSSQWSDNARYVIDECELRACQVGLTPENIKMIQGEVDYGFRTYTLHYDSIPAGELKPNVEIFSTSSRAKAIFCFMYETSNELDINAPAYFLGSDPDTMGINKVQFFINSKLFPLRAYDPRTTRDRPHCLSETSKAFDSIGQDCISFGDASGEKLNGYSNSFLICRELARGKKYVYDLTEAEPQLRLGFTATRTSIIRVNTFVWADKVIRVNNEEIIVIE